MTKKVIVIGCGAAGGTAAQFAKKTEREVEVVILEKGKFAQYSKCALPYLISGKVENVIEFSEKWFEKAGIDIFLRTEVVKIDSGKKFVYVKGSKEGKMGYDSLVIATGAKACIPKIEGIEANGGLKEGIFTLRNMEDALAIRSYMENCEKALIVGAGLVGLELAEALKSKGIDVTVVEMFPYILPSFLDPDMSMYLLEKIKDQAEILTNCKLEKVEKEKRFRSHIRINGRKETILSDMIVLCTGIEPETSIAREAGCKIGEKRGIVVNSRCETSVKDIYAAGDCTEYLDMVTGKPVVTGLGSTAVRQGMVAGINSVGGLTEIGEGFLQTRTAKIFGIEIAGVGPIAKLINRAIYGKYRGKTLPQYYPGGEDIMVKVAMNNEKEILGMQAIGEGAGLRANMVATAMANKMKADVFAGMETAYAPPVAPVFDPVSIAFKVALRRHGR